MSILRTFAFSAVGLLLVVGCGGGKSGGGVGDSEDPASDGGSVSANGGANSKAGSTSKGGKGSSTVGTNTAGTNNAAGSTNGTGSTNNGTGSTNNGTGSTNNGTGSTNNGTGSTGTGANGGAGSTNTGSSVGSTGSTGDPVGGSGSTGDPVGGNGSTGDPVGGTGNTGDPVGGNGNTGDPVGGNGNTGDPAGGTGNTGDPTGGKGNTGDPVGGSGNTGDPPGKCVPSEMANINVIVFKDATPTGADSEGGMYVGGNLTTPGYSVGGGTESGLTCADWGLVVGGSIVGPVVVKKGKVAYTGTADNTTSVCGVTPAYPVNFAALESKFIGYSLAFKNYPTNGTVSGSLVLTGTNAALNVFSVTAAQLTAASRIEFKAPAGSSIIVNVSGTDINWSGKGFLLPDGGVACRGGSSTAQWCERILWNFYEAQTIALSGIGVQGTILAPYATQSGGGGNVDGQVIVKYLTGGIEYHPYYFTGCLVLPTK